MAWSLVPTANSSLGFPRRLRLAVIYDPSHYHRHGAGFLVPRGHGLRLGGGGVGSLGVGDHGLADLPAAAPPPPEAGAGAGAQREAGHGAHRGHGLGEVSLQRVECGEGSLLVLVRQLPAKSRSSGPVSSDSASSCSMLL